MAAQHGTRRRYIDGCRCDDCTAANAAYQQRYRQRPSGVPNGTVDQVCSQTIGLVEAGVQSELAGLTQERPGLTQTALALARIMDSPKALSTQPAAAKVLAALLDKLRSASAPGHRGNLSLVRTVTEKG